MIFPKGILLIAFHIFVATVSSGNAAGTDGSTSPPPVTTPGNVTTSTVIGNITTVTSNANATTQPNVTSSTKHANLTESETAMTSVANTSTAGVTEQANTSSTVAAITSETNASAVDVPVKPKVTSDPLTTQPDMPETSTNSVTEMGKGTKPPNTDGSDNDTKIPNSPKSTNKGAIAAAVIISIIAVIALLCFVRRKLRLDRRKDAMRQHLFSNPIRFEEDSVL